MDTSIIVEIIAGLCTIIGVFITSKSQHNSTLEEIRRQREVADEEIKGDIKTIKKQIESLEKKQDKHNSLMERTFILEGKTARMEEKIKNLEEKIPG